MSQIEKGLDQDIKQETESAKFDSLEYLKNHNRSDASNSGRTDIPDGSFVIPPLPHFDKKMSNDGSEKLENSGSQHKQIKNPQQISV